MDNGAMLQVCVRRKLIAHIISIISQVQNICS